MDRKDLIGAYFLTNSKYYLDKFEKFENGEKFTFNFWAGFFGIIWFVYRKMYKQAVIIYLLNLVLTIFFVLFFPMLIYSNSIRFDNSFRTIYNLIVYAISFIVLGFISNNLYNQKVKLIVDNFIDNKGLEKLSNSDLDILRLQGGVNMNGAIFISVILFVIQIIARIIN
jgi:hypothetical protein